MTQLDLLTTTVADVAARAIARAPHDHALSEARRDRALREHTRRDTYERALIFARHYVRHEMMIGDLVTTDTLTSVVVDCVEGIELRVMGAVFRRLEAEGLLEQTGVREPSWRSHGSPKPVRRRVA